MTRWLTLVILVFAAACKDESPSPPEPELPSERRATEVRKGSDAPPQPELAANDGGTSSGDGAEVPSDPDALTLARKAAVLEQRTADAVRLCEAEDVSKMGASGALGCVLAACKERRGPLARRWLVYVERAQMARARQQCTALGATLSDSIDAGR